MGIVRKGSTIQRVDDGYWMGEVKSCSMKQGLSVLMPPYNGISPSPTLGAKSVTITICNCLRYTGDNSRHLSGPN